MSADVLVELVVDGVTVQGRAGQPLLELFREQALAEVPTLCHLPGPRNWSGCGLCAVRVAGVSGTVPACDTPTAAGMVVTTCGESVERARRTALDLLLEEHGGACRRPGAPPGGEPCALCALAERLGMEPGRPRSARRVGPDDSHPLVWHDPARCALCGRCLRACEEVRGTAALTLLGRGPDARIAPAFGRNLAGSGCEGCGACAEVCPTGALRLRLPRGPRPPPPGPWLRSACALCGLACPVEQRVHEDGVVLVRSGAGADGLRLCRRGRFGPGLILAAPVLGSPLVLQEGIQAQVEWPDATARAATLLAACAQRHGGDSLVVVVSGSLTLEAGILSRWLAEEGLGTTQAGCLRGLSRAGSSSPLGWTGSAGALRSVSVADLVLLVGADPERHQPALVARIDAAHRAGADLVVVHSDPTDLGSRASLWLDPRRGTQGVLLAAVLGLLAPQAPWEGRLPSVAEAATACGIQEDRIRDLAARLAGARRVIALYDMDACWQQGAGDLPALERILAHLGCLGTGLVLLRDEAGACGAAWLGLDADLPAVLRSGRVRGALVVEADPLSDPDLAPLLRDLDTLVVLGSGPTATTRAAHVVLPIPPVIEWAGTLLALDGGLRPLRPLRPPVAGHGLLDVLADLAEALGANPPARTAADLRAWLAEEHGLPPDSLQRARAAGGYWPALGVPRVTPPYAAANLVSVVPTSRPPVPLARLVDEGLAHLERRRSP